MGLFSRVLKISPSTSGDKRAAVRTKRWPQRQQVAPRALCRSSGRQRRPAVKHLHLLANVQLASEEINLRACAPALTAVGEATDAEIEIPPSLDNLVAALAQADVRISQETGKAGWPPAEWTAPLASLAVASFSRNDRRLIDFFVRSCEAAPQTTAAICHRLCDRFIGTPDEKVFVEAWGEIVARVLASSMWNDARYLQFGPLNLASALLPATIKDGRTQVPEVAQDLIDEWTNRFEGHSELVSPLVSYLMAVSPDVVVGKGLRWVLALRGDEPNRYDQRSGLGALLDRLSVGIDIRSVPKDAAARYYRLLDQLAVAGDPDALRAQVRLEQA
jgi:hypothetical protein